MAKRGNGGARGLRKLIRDFGVPRDNVDGKGKALTVQEQRQIADNAKTQNGRIGGS
jgi:hypothetical protein